MSERELRRAEVLSRVAEGGWTLVEVLVLASSPAKAADVDVMVAVISKLQNHCLALVIVRCPHVHGGF